MDEAYLRASWKPDDLVVGVSKGQLVIHAGGQPVLFEPGVQGEPPANLPVQTVDFSGAELVDCHHMMPWPGCGGEGGSMSEMPSARNTAAAR